MRHRILLAIAIAVAALPVNAGEEPPLVTIDTKLIEVELDPTRRFLIDLNIPTDCEQIGNELGVDPENCQATPIPEEAGGGTLVSLPITGSLLSGFENGYCLKSQVRLCEPDSCQDFQLPELDSHLLGDGDATIPDGKPDSDDESQSVTVRVTDPNGKPVDANVTAAPTVGNVEGFIAGQEIEWDAGSLKLGHESLVGSYGLSLGATYESMTFEAASGWSSTTWSDDDANDPRDTPPPTIYGEELGGPVGILLMRDSDRWIPKYAKSTWMNAELYQKRNNVWVRTEEKRIIHIRFVERSRQKGVCLNKDIQPGPQNSPDLYFPADKNDTSTCDESEVKAHLYKHCQTNEPKSYNLFTVTSEDFGSWSLLEAYCDECVPLKRPLDWNGIDNIAVEANVAKREHMVKLPKDDNHNQIADGWYPDELHKPGSDDDKEDDPVGNGVKGDGLSAYEEYRGFYVKDEHTRTSLEKKDFFVHNRDNLPMGKFRASELRVHQVNGSELAGAKGTVINFNFGHSHLHDQNGVKLVVDNNISAMGRAVHTRGISGLGPPKNVVEVKVNRSRSDSEYDLAETTAHELAHSVKIEHHGPRGKTERILVTHVADLRGWPSYRYRGGISVEAKKLCGYDLPARIWFGEKHSVTSGMASCNMRYYPWGTAFMERNLRITCAKPYAASGDFCDSPNGTGYNAGGRAASNATKGNCKSQLQVNDGE